LMGKYIWKILEVDTDWEGPHEQTW
jgi:hypothetical protein